MLLPDNNKRYNLLKNDKNKYSDITNNYQNYTKSYELPKLPEELSIKNNFDDKEELSLRYQNITTEKILLKIFAYKNLKYLDLSYNLIDGLPHGLPSNLYALDLSNNKINSLSNYSVYCQLVELHLSYNQLITTKGLGSITSLQYIDLSYNKINIIEDLELLTNLSFINLCGNLISNTLSLRLLHFNKSVTI